MNQDKKKILILVLSYGALWGFAEASLGYVLHWIDPFLPGIVMFPIAAALLLRFHAASGSRGAVVLVGVVAAAVKAVDFLLPTIAPLRVANPIVCILLEALAMALVVPAIVKAPVWKRIALFPAASILWRAGFVLALFVEWPLLGTPSGQITSLAAIVSFMVVSGLEAGAIASAVDLAVRKFPAAQPRLFARPAFAAALAVLAVVATYLLS